MWSRFIPPVVAIAFVDIAIVGLHDLLKVVLHRVCKRNQAFFVVVEIERLRLYERANIMLGKRTGNLMRPIGTETQLSQGGSAKLNRRSKCLPLIDICTCLDQGVSVRPVPRPRENLELREVLLNCLGALNRHLFVVDRKDEELCPFRTGGSQQVDPGRIPVVDFVAIFSDELDLMGIVIEHGRADTLRVKHSRHNLAKAAIPRDDNRIAFVLDRIGFVWFAQAREAGLDQAFVNGNYPGTPLLTARG